ncbi:DUF3558 domain-containing protein [Streptomyces sioyaensis]|uniref:DUF3558 domain-containing protein n=1 Tax=Streptomyces sioyaensis TaxID=67364 RepID=UPI00379468AF
MNVMASRFARLLACAAVPAMVIASGSAASASPHSGQQESPAPLSAPAPHAADYPALPNPCKTISRHTVHQMVPNADNPNGESHPDPNVKLGCNWQGGPLDQWHSLSSILERFDSAPGGASGRDRAKAAYKQKVQYLVKVNQWKVTSLSGLGDQATLLTGDWKEDGYQFHTASVVFRSANAVVFIDFYGTGMQAAKMSKQAQQAAKEALASLKR